MNPLLLDFPNQFETDRLVIRAPRPGDGAAMNRAVLESWAELKVWMPWAQKEPSLAQSEAIVRESYSRWVARTDLQMLLFTKEGELVGSSGLHRMDWSVPRFEIGYWLKTSACGRGYMTEAVRGIAGFAFQHLGARRVEIHCAKSNLKSAAVARRAGFIHEATLRNYSRLPDNTLADAMVFAHLRSKDS